MSYKPKSAEKPEVGGMQYHIRLKKNDIPSYVIIPGDPKRVSKIALLWNKSKLVADRVKNKFKITDQMEKNVALVACEAVKILQGK